VSDNKYDLSGFKHKGGARKKYAEDLYGKQGFSIIKGFLKKKDVQYILDTYIHNYDYSRQIEEQKKAKRKKIMDGGYHAMNTKYFYKNRKSDNDVRMNSIIKDVFNERNKVILQEECDKFSVQYCMKRGLDINDIDAISNSQLNHTTARITQYLDSQGQVRHMDSPGEVQALVFLTKQGVDYEGGGLHIYYDDGKVLSVDQYLNPGDLVLFNAYSFSHSAEPIKTKDGQIGRVQLFSHLHPQWSWGEYSVFRNDKFKLYFSGKKPLILKVLYYLSHYSRLLLGRPIYRDSKVSKR
jgi:hypothetical protein